MGWTQKSLTKSLKARALRIRKCNGETQVINRRDDVVFRILNEDASVEKIGKGLTGVTNG